VEHLEGLIRRWLESQGGTVQAGGDDSELLHRVATECRVRGKGGLAHVRSTLCEMAARNRIRVVFGKGDYGDAPITSIAIFVARPKSAGEKLDEQLATLLEENAQLKRDLESTRGDLEAAEELSSEAVAGQQSAEAALRELRDQHQEALAEAERLRRQAPTAPSPSVTLARRKAEGRAVATARARMHQAEEAVENLRERLAAARRHIRTNTPTYQFYKMTCGCVIARTDVTQCMFGGRTHPIFPLMVPKLPYAQAKAFIEVAISYATTHMAGNGVGIILSSDLRGRAMP
jgi:hypothetical protein